VQVGCAKVAVQDKKNSDEFRVDKEKSKPNAGW
jgi:hypothetical protein